MAKPLVFSFGGAELPFAMTKVDRSKLYGYKEVEVLDEKERRCELATLAGDGQTLVGRGGTAVGYLSPDGLWYDRAELKPVDLEGQAIEPVPSSFSAPVSLVEEATIDEYLSHNIRAIYLLTSDEDVAPLLEKLREGAIFKFPYSFRGGLVADAGFLLMSADGDPFLAVGSPTSIEFIGLQQALGTAEEEPGEEEEEEAMDFGMI